MVVDEFAAVVGGRPEWHALFADLAARGRSLGIHLILCTQRPAGVVRDAVLANVAVRIALRLRERADSMAFLGTESAARLPAAPHGRAVLSTPERPERVLQVAIASPSDIEPMLGSPGPAAPWCPPLPTRLPLRQLDRVETGVAIGLVDLPDEQRREPLVLRPADGPVLVLGGRGSGRSSALATIGAASGGLWLPSDAAALRALLEEGLEVRPGEALLLDDLDRVLERCPEDHRPELSAMLARELADAARRGAVVAAAAERLPYGLAAAFGPRLLLRASTREEHVLAGGDPTGFDPERPPGSGTWRGREVQVAIAEPGDDPHPLRTARPPAPVLVELAGELAIVTPAVRRLADLLTAAGCTVQRVGEPEAVVARGMGAHVLLGDPDAWAGDWAALGRARRDLAMLLVECDLADHRSITRSRALPPILAPGESWLVRDGRTVRAILDLGG